MSSFILLPLQFFSSGFRNYNEATPSCWELAADGVSLQLKEVLPAQAGFFETHSVATASVCLSTGSTSDGWWTRSGDSFMPALTNDPDMKDFQVTMSVETPNFRIYKALSSDKNEYAIVNTNIDLKYPWVATCSQAVYIEAYDYFFNLDNISHLQIASSSDYTDVVNLSCSKVYGTSVEISDYGYNQIALTNWPSNSQVISLWPAATKYQYYRWNQTNPHASQEKMYVFMHGILMNLPNGYMIEDKTTEYRYPKSSTDRNLLGDITFDGVQNTGYQRSFNLEFQYLPSSSMSELVDMYKLGKGGLPVLFVEDSADVSTWIICGMKNLSVKEIVAGGFNVSFELQEF
jgi:hypothetical protein